MRMLNEELFVAKRKKKSVNQKNDTHRMSVCDLFGEVRLILYLRIPTCSSHFWCPAIPALSSPLILAAAEINSSGQVQTHANPLQALCQWQGCQIQEEKKRNTGCLVTYEVQIKNHFQCMYISCNIYNLKKIQFS